MRSSAFSTAATIACLAIFGERAPFTIVEGDAKTAPRRVIKAEKAEKLSNLPGKALEQKAKAGIKPKVKPLGGLKASASKKSGSNAFVGKGARGGARQVSRSGRVRTGQKGGAKR